MIKICFEFIVNFLLCSRMFCKCVINVSILGMEVFIEKFFIAFLLLQSLMIFQKNIIVSCIYIFFQTFVINIRICSFSSLFELMKFIGCVIHINDINLRWSRVILWRGNSILAILSSILWSNVRLILLVTLVGNLLLINKHECKLNNTQ